MLVWRLTKPEHAPGLDGEGARLWGGRWNSPGVPMIYCASSLALAALEVLVHLPPSMRRPGMLPPLVAVGLELPDAEVPHTVGAFFDQNDCRFHGDNWITNKSDYAVRVPSFVIQRETNVLLNPTHPRMFGIRLLVQEPFVFEDRLLP